MNVRGKSIQDIMDISIDDFNKLNEKDLRELTKRLSSAANKRVKRMEAAGEKSPSMRNLMESGGKISVKDKTFNQLRHEFGRARNFLQNKTSSLRGWKKVKQTVINELENMDVELKEKDYDKFFDLYEKLKEKDPSVSMKSLKYKVFKKISESKLDYEELILKMQEELVDLYKETVSEGEVATDVSGFFERGTIG